MNDINPDLYIQKYFDQSLTADETEMFLEWLGNPENTKKFVRNIEMEDAFNEFFLQPVIIDSKDLIRRSSSPPFFKGFLWLIPVILILAVGIASLFYFFPDKRPDLPDTTALMDLKNWSYMSADRENEYDSSKLQPVSGSGYMYTKNVRIRGKSVKALTLDPSGIPGKFLWVRLDIPLTEVSFAIEMDNIYERPLGKPNIVKIGLIDEPQPVINLYPKGLFVSPIKKADAGVWKTYRFEYFPADNGMVDCHMYYGGMEIARIRRPRPDTLKRIFLVKNTLVSLANIRIIPLKMQSE